MSLALEHSYFQDKHFVLIDSWIDWETVWISAWIHWNEYAWVDALEDFKNKIISWEISITKWKILLILKWNVEALKEDKRFKKHDLNRCINNYTGEYDKNDYEIKRWKKIKELIYKVNSKYWLDLHTVSAPW
jgi:succinylglutamate desuccinylase